MFQNNDQKLTEQAEEILSWRKKAGLEGMVGGLEWVEINTEPENQRNAVQELLRYTGLQFVESFSSNKKDVCVLRTDNSADFLVTSRKTSSNPFRNLNEFPKTKQLPNTRLETFVFRVDDLKRFVAIQKEQGNGFLTEKVENKGPCLFIQTKPSPYTYNSIGYVQWLSDKRLYRQDEAGDLPWEFEKPRLGHLENIQYLDHVATRVKAEERDEAILEFMKYTNYHFEFAIYVKTLNSITNVARLTKDDFAMVFTSGIEPYNSQAGSGPTEKFIHNHGPRAHHMAFHTEKIDETYASLREDGLEFLVELVGSPAEGLKQTFTQPSPRTFLVNEYIHRYGEFDGFFTKSNVTKLTEATDKQ